MKTFSGKRSLCPNFNRKKISYYGFLYYIPFEDFIQLVERSHGLYINSYLDVSLDYIILNEDMYYRFINKQFKKYDELYYIYWNSVKFNTIVISEMQLLRLVKSYNNETKISLTMPKRMGSHTFYPQKDYIVMSLTTTGWDYYYDQPYQIGALKVEDGSIADTFISNIQPMENYNDIVNNIYSYTMEKSTIKDSKVFEEAVIRYLDFAGNLPIVSCNTYLKNEFISFKYYSVDMKYVDNPYVDILELANNLQVKSHSCNLQSIMKSLDLNVLNSKSSILMRCMNMLSCYETLKDRMSMNLLESFQYNPFFNRSFAFEGIFKKFARKKVYEIIITLGGKVCYTLSRNTSFLVLSNDSYYNYLNGKKSAKVTLAQSLIFNGSNLKIVSENVMYSTIVNYQLENHIKIM